MKITDKEVFTTTVFYVEHELEFNEEYIITHHSEGDTIFTDEWEVVDIDHNEVDEDLENDLVEFCKAELNK